MPTTAVDIKIVGYQLSLKMLVINIFHTVAVLLITVIYRRFRAVTRLLAKAHNNPAGRFRCRFH